MAIRSKWATSSSGSESGSRLAEEATLVEIRELEADYEILGELGRGGMSIVYLARDRELGRDVAIKVIHTASGIDDETIARQLNEARTVAQLQHPNVVAIHAVKRLSTRGLALVMQYIPGRSLERAIHEDGPFAPERAEAVLIDIAAALAYAHARGVVHRDVKPENIFLNDETGRALLSDFGIALSAEMRRQTPSADLLVGTPAYMSPEQIDGQALDGRSDLFSLGLVGYEMLLGVRPWVDMNVADVMYRQKFDPLPAIAGARGDVPPRLVAVTERALEKNRDARWESAQAFLSALSDDEWVRDRTAQASAATTTNRLAQHLPPLAGSTMNAGSTALHTMQYRRGQDDVPNAPHPSFDGGLPDLSLIPVPTRRRNGPIGLILAGGALVVGALLTFLINPDLLWKHTPSARAFSGSSATVAHPADTAQLALIQRYRDSLAKAGQEAIRRAADSAAAATSAADSTAALQLVARQDSETRRLTASKSTPPPPPPATVPKPAPPTPTSTVSESSATRDGSDHPSAGHLTDIRRRAAYLRARWPGDGAVLGQQRSGPAWRGINGARAGRDASQRRCRILANRLRRGSHVRRQPHGHRVLLGGQHVRSAGYGRCCRSLDAHEGCRRPCVSHYRGGRRVLVRVDCRRRGMVLGPKPVRRARERKHQQQ